MAPHTYAREMGAQASSSIFQKCDVVSGDVVPLGSLTFEKQAGSGRHGPRIFQNAAGERFFAKPNERLFLNYVVGKILHGLFPQGVPASFLSYEDMDGGRQWFALSPELSGYLSHIDQLDGGHHYTVQKSELATLRALIHILQVTDLGEHNVGVRLTAEEKIYPAIIDYDEAFDPYNQYSGKIHGVFSWESVGLSEVKMRAIELLTPTFLKLFQDTITEAHHLFDLHEIPKGELHGLSFFVAHVAHLMEGHDDLSPEIMDGYFKKMGVDPSFDDMERSFLAASDRKDKVLTKSLVGYLVHSLSEKRGILEEVLSHIMHRSSDYQKIPAAMLLLEQGVGGASREGYYKRLLDNATKPYSDGELDRLICSGQTPMTLIAAKAKEVLDEIDSVERMAHRLYMSGNYRQQSRYDEYIRNNRGHGVHAIMRFKAMRDSGYLRKTHPDSQSLAFCPR